MKDARQHTRARRLQRATGIAFNVCLKLVQEKPWSQIRKMMADAAASKEEQANVREQATEQDVEAPPGGESPPAGDGA